VVELDRQPAEQPRAQRRLALAETGQRALEQRDGLGIVAEHGRGQPAAPERGPRELDGVASRRGGLGEARPRRLDLAESQVRIAEPEQKLGAPLAGRSSPLALAVADRSECAFEVEGGILVGQPRHGGACGARRVLDHLRGRATRKPEVVRELGVLAAGTLERLAHAPVQQRAAGAGELGVDRLAHERVREHRAAGLLADQVRGECGVERRDERVTRHPARGLEHVGPHLAAGHRGEL
jgi:hypothetical protein